MKNKPSDPASTSFSSFTMTDSIVQPRRLVLFSSSKTRPSDDIPVDHIRRHQGQ